MALSRSKQVHGWRCRIRPALTRRSLVRAFWATVLLLHAPISFSVFSSIWRSDGDIRWSSILLLAASNAFFILEIAFGFSVNLWGDRRKLITFFVAVALLHVGVMERATPDVWRDLDLRPSLLFATVSVVALRGLSRALPRAIESIRACCSPPIEAARRRYAHWAVGELSRWSPVFVPVQLPSRAPPAQY